MKNLFILLLITASINTVAQVAVNTDGSLPDNSAMLDIKSTAKGLLIPRMTEAERNTMASPAQALIIYQTDNTAGFYYYDGSAWIRLTALSTDAGWKLDGNSDTTNGTHFLGTTGNQALDIKTKNTLKLRITTKGQIETLNTGNSVFIGEGAGANDDLSNNKNVLIGYNSGYSNVSGMGNVSVGFEALKENINGNGNTAVGYTNLKLNTGIFNTAIGYKTLYNSKKNYNTVVGENALYLNVNGEDNVVMGKESFYYNKGSKNVALGAFAGYYKEGNENVFIGYNSGLYDNTNTNNNLYINDSGSITLIYGNFYDKYITIYGKLRGQDSGDADMKAYIYGKVTASGGLILDAWSGGYSLNKIATGIYEIRFFSEMPVVDAYSIIANINWGNGIGFIRFRNYSTTAARIYTYNSFGNLSDKPFSFVVYKK